MHSHLFQHLGQHMPYVPLPFPRWVYNSNSQISIYLLLIVILMFCRVPHNLLSPYVDRNVFYRIIYGFRIEIYDKNEQLILRQEAFDSKRNVLTNDEHYAPIAPKVNTSIPQIRRDFTERFRNGSRYLEAAGHRFDQPTHHARRILELQELYDDNVLDYFIGVAIDEDMMDITSFRSLLRDYNNGYRTLFEEPRDYASSKNELIRDCSYYEQSTKEVAP